MDEEAQNEGIYYRGTIAGVLQGIVLRAEDTSFDEERWRSLYGQKLVHSSVPAYPSQEAREKDEDAFVIADWNAETEEKRLKKGVSLPQDRPGDLVFENGTAVVQLGGRKHMVTLTERELGYIRRLAEGHIETLRKAHE